MLGGNIWMASEVGKGTIFCFTIPDNERTFVKQPLKQTFSGVVKGGNMKKNAILIAEDDDVSLIYLIQVLNDIRLSILTVKNGEDAVKYCLDNPGINLVLMDIKMPVMDGFTAAKQIKAFRPDLKIIAQTAFALEMDKEKYTSIFDDYITKPIKADELKMKIVKHLRKERRLS